MGDEVFLLLFMSTSKVTTMQSLTLTKFWKSSFLTQLPWYPISRTFQCIAWNSQTNPLYHYHLVRMFPEEGKNRRRKERMRKKRRKQNISLRVSSSIDWASQAVFLKICAILYPVMLAASGIGIERNVIFRNV